MRTRDMLRFGIITICAALTLSRTAMAADTRETEPAEKMIERVMLSINPPRETPIIATHRYPISHRQPLTWTMSSDAKRLATLHADGKIVVADVREKLEEVCVISSPNCGPDSKLALAPDGLQVVVGHANGKVEVYDAQSGRLLHTQVALSQPIIQVGFAPDGQRIFALDRQGNSIVTRPLQDGERHLGPELPEGAEVQKASIAATGDDNWWKFVQVGDKIEHYFSVNGKFLRPIIVEASNLTALHGCPGNRYVVADEARFLVFSISSEGEKTNLNVARRYTLGKIKEAFVTDDGEKLWFHTDTNLNVHSFADREQLGLHQIPNSVRKKDGKFFPNAGIFAFVDDNGLVVHRPDGPPKPLTMATGGAIDYILNGGRFDVIEQLAKRWDGEIEHFRDDEHETPYSYLMSRVQGHTLPGELPEHRNGRYLKWIEENPENCQFMRIAMFRIYLAEGYRARGQGFANSVTEEGWKIFYDNMVKMWKVVEPIFEDKHVPAEAYTCAIIAGKNLQWERSEINDYLKRSFAKWPNYHRTYTEEAVARLERWGGGPGDTAAFAEKLANKIGADDGDIMYAEIARHVTPYFGLRNVMDATGMSPERATRGLTLLAEKYQRPRLFNEALFYAGFFELEADATRIAKQMDAANIRPSTQLWPGKYPTIDKAFEGTRWKAPMTTPQP